MLSNYPKACTEILEIFKYLTKENAEKIPKQVYRNLERFKDAKYQFRYNLSKRLEEQELLDETKALFLNLYSEFLALEEEKMMWEKYDLYCQRVDMEEQLKRYRRLSADKTHFHLLHVRAKKLKKLVGEESGKSGYEGIYNPLAKPYRYYQSGDIDRTAKMLNYLGLEKAADFEKKKALYWKKEAVDLFTGLGLMLYACEKKESKIHMGSIWNIRSYMEIDETKKNGPIFWDFLNTFSDDSAVRQKLSFMHNLHLDPKRQKKKFWGIVKSFDAMMHRYPKEAYGNLPHFFLPDYMCHILRAKLKLMGGEELTLDEIFADTPDHILFEFELDEIDVLGIRR